MALKTYIGARYAPQFMGEYDSTIEYKPLSVVYSGGISYTSRTYVPANTPLTDASFWVKSADYNAQVAQYRQEVQQYASQIDTYKQEVDQYVATVTRLDNQMQAFTTSITADFNRFKQEVNTANQQMQENVNQQVNEVKAFADETLHSFDTKAQMVADRSLETGQTLLTCGGDSLGDGKASFYQVQDSATTDTVALANGKFAKPFKLQAYDVAQGIAINHPTCTRIGGDNTTVSVNLGDAPNFKFGSTIYCRVDVDEDFPSDMKTPDLVEFEVKNISNYIGPIDLFIRFDSGANRLPKYIGIFDLYAKLTNTTSADSSAGTVYIEIHATAGEYTNNMINKIFAYSVGDSMLNNTTTTHVNWPASGVLIEANQRLN